MAGGEGFEPSTSSLEGWRSIRTELLAQLSWNKNRLFRFKPSYRQHFKVCYKQPRTDSKRASFEIKVRFSSLAQLSYQTKTPECDQPL